MRKSLHELINCLENNEADAALISSPENRRYYSGFTGSNGLLFIHPLVTYLITDFRYIEQGKRESPGCKIIDAPGKKAIEFLLEVCRKLGVHSLWFEEDHITYNYYMQLDKILTEISLIPSQRFISGIRAVKTPSEIEFIKKAAQLADDGFNYILDYIREGITEQEVALELEFYLRKNGSQEMAFKTIVASGENAALPHAVPTNKKLNNGDVVVLDFGCVVEGYCSDMTRTIAIGQTDERLQEIYQVVLQAQMEAISKLKPGQSSIEADQTARKIIQESGYGDYFGHGLGHGVGLNVHEAPSLSQRGTDILKPNMVVTIEPGVYIPGLGGIRIEDLVVITEKGIQNLTTSPKFLTLRK